MKGIYLYHAWNVYVSNALCIPCIKHAHSMHEIHTLNPYMALTCIASQILVCCLHVSGICLVLLLEISCMNISGLAA